MQVKSNPIASHPICLRAGIATGSAELVLVVDLVVTVARDTRRRHIGLLHAVDGRAGRVVFAANLGVAGVGGVVVEGGDFGDVLAVGLALVLDGLGIEVLVTVCEWSFIGVVCGFTWFWTGALDMIGACGLYCLLSIDVVIEVLRSELIVECELYLKKRESSLRE